MAINCYLTIAGTVIHPELPVAREAIIVGEDKRMLNGQLRRAYRGVRYRFTLTLRDATEAERSAWILAAGGGAGSITYTDEFASSRTVLVTEIREDLTRTVPASEGGAATTGPGYYDLTLVVEEV